MTTQVLQQTLSGKLTNRRRKVSARSAATIAITFAAFALAASPALAGEAHPKIGEFGSFSNPNGIAVEESTGDVYVADIGTDTVYKFDASGNPVDFSALGSNALTGGATPTGSFSFPETYGTPAAIAVDNSTSPTDPSVGDLYVMDAGHDAIDKFNAKGEYLNQITGPFSGELRGFGVQANGDVRVDDAGARGPIAFDLFDNAAANNFVTSFGTGTEVLNGAAGLVREYGFAVGLTGDGYLLYECGCVEKFGGSLAQLGRVDSGPGDVAVAADPVSGHLYVDDQSSIAEWDTGDMDGQVEAPGNAAEDISSATLVGSSFTTPGLSGVFAQQGGIAVNGATGTIYVSNPADGEVYVFGSTAPGVAAGAAGNVTETGATLRGSVDPRGVPVTSCEFEYEKAPERIVDSVLNLATPVAAFGHTVPCEQTAEQIGAGTSPIAVTADISGLQPGALYDFRLVAPNADGTSPSSGLLATVGPGFGVKDFGVSFLNQNGTPDTQAGSHPNTVVASWAFNTTDLRLDATVDSPYQVRPDGNVKDITVDLPPGFVGDPNATPAKCTLRELENSRGSSASGNSCPPGSQVGELEVEFVSNSHAPLKEPIFNMVPPHGVALQVGANFIAPLAFVNFGLQTGGDYPVKSEGLDISAIEPIKSIRLTAYGVVGEGENRKPFLTLPTGCTGPLRSTIEADSYQEPEEPGQMVKAESITSNAAGEPVNLTGCSKLTFPPRITVKSDTTNASSASGLTVDVNVSQKAALNPEGLAESALRDATVTLPEGVAINPSGANGLEACSEGLAGFQIGRGVNGSGFEEFNPNFEPGDKTPLFSPTPLESLQPGVSLCPDGAKIGTVDISSPLLPKGQDLTGSVYLAAQNANPFGSLIAMYMFVEDPISGSTIKLTGEVSLNPDTGQIVTTFKNTPDLPFENLEIHFFGGERAPLTTPSRCGTYTTTAMFTPWDGNAPVEATSSFEIEHGPDGGPCPGAQLPFAPTVNGGATNIQAGAFSPLTVTLSRKDGEQNLKSVEAKLPPGLSGVLTGVELCPEPRANEGLCGENSKVGEATVSVGVGGDPFTVSGGKFYLTGPYNGSGGCTVGTQGCAPFGLTFEVPAKAGPFDLERNSANPAGEDACDCVLVRGKLEINPLTSAITITTNPPGTPDSIPTSIEGIPLEIQHVNAVTTRGNFQFNPTNCAKMALVGTVGLNEGGTRTISTPFQVTNCAALKFEPKFSVSTSGKTSKANGASLSAKVTYPNVPQGTDADIAKVKVELPKQLPSRLTTLQKACTAKQFEANPAGCPAESKIGYAVVHTPILPVPLVGPAIFVSHGGEAFPSLTMVLQGDGVTIELVGTTFISKAGITSTTFKTVPDQPFSTFELTLPEGKYSALAANGNLCTSKLAMPIEFVAQNGAEIHQSTKIGVTGCAKKKALTRAQKLAAALKACHKKKGAKRASCVRLARKRYGPLKKGKHGKQK